MTNEELRQEIIELRFNQLESKCEPIPTSYQVKIPSDLENYYTIDIDGSIEELYSYTHEIRVVFYLRGLAFKTKTEAEQLDKERILLFKLHKWAEEHNGDWTLNWKANEPKYYVTYDYYGFSIKWSYLCNNFIKLPYFKTKELAEQFIDEFGEEIKEVLC